MSAPVAPTNVQALSGSNQRAYVSWTASAGATSYTVTSSPGGFTAATANTYAYVTGLTNGTAYTFTVTATNANGTGAPSSASNSVTPSTSFTPTTAADLIGRSMICVVNATSSTLTNWQRIVDFNDGSSSNYMFITSYTSDTQRARLGAKHSSGGESSTSSSSTIIVPGTYIFVTIFHSLTTIGFRIYRYVSGSLTEFSVSTNPLTIDSRVLGILTSFRYGRSSFSGDNYLNAEFVQITFSDGDISQNSPTTSLLPLVNTTITNSYTANSYTFAGTTGFYSVNVGEAVVGSGTYTNSSTTLFLNGVGTTNGAYLTLTSFADNGGGGPTPPAAINYISRVARAVVAPVPQGAMQPVTGQTRFMGFGGGFGRQRPVAAGGGGGGGGSGGASNPIYYVDALNASSYSGSGSSMTNLGSASVTSQLLNYSYTPANLGIELNAAVKTGYLHLSSVANVQTIVMWYKYNASQSGSYNYIIDARNGLSAGYINTGDGVGPGWQNTAYFNDSGGNVSSFSLSDSANWSKFYSLPGQWIMAVITAASPFTDDIRFFNRFETTAEGPRVIFGPIKIYDRVLNASEVKLDFNQFATRYGYATLP